MKDWQGNKVKFSELYKFNLAAIFVYVGIGIAIGYCLFK